MATRAVMLGINYIYTGAIADEFLWEVDWEFIDTDGGITEHFRNQTSIMWTDTGATIVSKLVDKIVADALAQRGYTVARTSVFIISYQKGV